MISSRYRYDGQSILTLNDVQKQALDSINHKVENGIYDFETIPCNICLKNSFSLLSKKDRYGLYMPVVICKSCGLIQTNPRMTEKSYAAFYNCEYRKLYGGEEGPSEDFFTAQYYRGKAIFSYLSKAEVLVRPPQELYVLEIGCGAGGILQFFKEQGCRVKGLDLGQEYIDFGRSKYMLDLSKGTIWDERLVEQPDVIIYCHVLEHILDPKKEAGRISDLLSPDGVIYIEVPGVKNLLYSYEMDFLRMLQNAHTYHFTLTTLQNVLCSAGFGLVVADEKIRSVFKKTTPLMTNYSYKNDYESALQYLYAVDKTWKIVNLLPYYIKKVLVDILQKKISINNYRKHRADRVVKYIKQLIFKSFLCK